MEVYVDTLRLLAQPKGQQQFKNKKQAELTENRTVVGSLTTKEIKEKNSSRPVRGAETGSQGGEDSWQGSGWRIQRGGGLWNEWGRQCNS